MHSVPRAWNFQINFIGYMGPILWFSGGLCLLSVIALATFGLHYGTDFAGGYELQVIFPTPVSETEIRASLEPLDLDEVRVQRYGPVSSNEWLVLVRGDVNMLSAAKQTQLRQALLQQLSQPTDLQQMTIAESGDSAVIGFATPFTAERLQQVFTDLGINVKQVHSNGREDRPEYRLELLSLADRIDQQLHTTWSIPAEQSMVQRMDFVGPQVGSQQRSEAVLAVALALFGILLYIALRFDLLFSPGAVLATLHDVLVVLGVFAVFQIEFDQNVVIALLTLVGFSLNDTVVVYDRIRENVQLLRNVPTRELVNRSINETLSRTILTSGTVLLVVLALLLIAGPAIRSFSIAMCVGVVVATYSSIVVASPLYILLRDYLGDGKGNAKRQGKQLAKTT